MITSSSELILALQSSSRRREASVVDYFISSPDLLKYLSNFEIHEQSKLFSDVHRPIGASVLNVIDTVEQYQKQ
jgi:hypothetical protein